MARQNLRFFGLAAFVLVVMTGTSAVAADAWVEGKYRRDGTYVPGHYRTVPDTPPIDYTKPNKVPKDERSRGGLYQGGPDFGTKALFGRGNRSNGRGSRLGD